MQVKAIQRQMKVVEVPVSTKKRIGRSKISGTISGTIGAAFGIFGMIFQLYMKEKQSRNVSELEAKPIKKTGLALKVKNLF